MARRQLFYLSEVGDRGHRLCVAGASPAHRCFAAIAGRSAAHSHLHPVGLHLDCVLLRADAGIRRAAFLSERPFWLFGGGDRTVDHALADRDRLRGAACGAFGRALSRWPSGWHRTSSCSREG